MKSWSKPWLIYAPLMLTFWLLDSTYRWVLFSLFTFISIIEIITWLIKTEIYIHAANSIAPYCERICYTWEIRLLERIWRVNRVPLCSKRAPSTVLVQGRRVIRSNLGQIEEQKLLVIIINYCFFFLPIFIQFFLDKLYLFYNS